MNFTYFFSEIMDHCADNSFIHQWDIFYGYAYNISRCDDGKYYVDVTYDYRDGRILVAEVSDYINKRAYRWVEPSFKEEYNEWQSEHGFSNFSEAVDIDGNKYIELSSDEKFCKLAKAIINGEEYDDRETIELEIHDSELLALMKLAHEKDITLNQLVTEILENEISKFTAHDN